MFDSQINEAIDLIKRGERRQAHLVLDAVLKNDPDNERAWMWLSVCYEQNNEKVYCLQRVLEINPKNKHAINGLKKLGVDVLFNFSSRDENINEFEQSPILNSKNYNNSGEEYQEKKSKNISKKTKTLLAIAGVCFFCVTIFSVSLLPKKSGFNLVNVSPTKHIVKTLPPIWTPTRISGIIPNSTPTKSLIPTEEEKQDYSSLDSDILIPPSFMMKGYSYDNSSSGSCGTENYSTCKRVVYSRSDNNACFLKIEYEVTILPTAHEAEYIYSFTYDYFVPYSIKTAPMVFMGIDKAILMLFFSSEAKQGSQMLLIQDENMFARIEVRLDRNSTSPECEVDIINKFKLLLDKVHR
jgi:hypothetical protein